MSVNIYVLKLKDDCYYVGKSQNVQQRYNDHQKGKGSVWTRLHTPLAIDHVIENASSYDEDRVTKEYMAQYGIDKVRGGAYVRKILPKTTVQMLQKEIRMAQNLCLKCGKAGHFAKYCHAIKKCTRCGRSNHTAEKCYAKTKTDGSTLVKNTTSRQKCTRCGRSNHTAEKCYAKTKTDGSTLVKDADRDGQTNTQECIIS